MEDVFNVSKGIVLMLCLTIRSIFCWYVFDREVDYYSVYISEDLCVQ